MITPLDRLLFDFLSTLIHPQRREGILEILGQGRLHAEFLAGARMNERQLVCMQHLPFSFKLRQIFQSLILAVAIS